MESDAVSDRLSVIEQKLERIWSRIDEISGRLSNYLGPDIATTYLKNGNLIYVNTNDFGPPANFLDGGEYEPDNLQVLLSFVGPDTIFVDVGANLGFFSLVIGDRMRRGGKVIAFEPQPWLIELFSRSIHHNGLRDIVTLHPFGLSDTPGRFSLWMPKGHRGGATLTPVDEARRGGYNEIKIETRRLDDLFGDDFVCDLVKIDVEEHELAVLNGMRGVVARSPNIKILIEKLSRNAGVEDAFADYFADFDMKLYGVTGRGLEGPLSRARLREWQGYLLAAHISDIDHLDRRRFSIYPSQMLGRTSQLKGGRLVAEGPGLMAHGPYWNLPRGGWRMTVHGQVQGEVNCVVNERFGLRVANASISPGSLTADFIIERDLTKFECAFRGAAGARISIERIDWNRID